MHLTPLNPTQYQHTSPGSEMGRMPAIKPPLVDNFFPFFLTYQRNCIVTMFISQIIYLFNIIQDILILSWAFVGDVPEESVKNIFYIFLINHESTVDQLAIEILVMAASFFIISICISFYFMGRLSYTLLYISDICVHIFLYILTKSVAIIVGTCINQYFENQTTILLVLIIIGSLDLIIACEILLLDAGFFSYSNVFQDSITATSNHYSEFFRLIGSSIAAVIIPLSKKMGFTVKVLICIIQIINYMFSAVRSFEFSYLHTLPNIIQPSFYIAASLTPIFIIFDIWNNVSYRIYCFTLIFLTSLIITIFIYQNKKKRLLLKNYKNAKEAIVSLFMSLSYNVPDFEPIYEYLSTQTLKTREHLMAAAVASYFPQYHSYFIEHLQAAKEGKNISSFEHYMIFTLNLSEQSKIISSVIPKIDELRRLSHDIAAAFSDTWIEFSGRTKRSPVDTLYTITRMSNNCERRWTEALSFYPRNVSLTIDYANYLIECNSDFMHANDKLYQAYELADGKIFSFDKSENSFLKIYPHFFKMVTKGSQLASMDNADPKEMMAKLNERLPQAKLRIEFQRTLLSVKVRPLFFLKIIMALRLVYFIACFIVMIIQFSSNLNFRLESLKFIHNITRIGNNMNVGLIMGLTYAAEEVGIPRFYNDEYKEFESSVNSQYIINWTIPDKENMMYYANGGLANLSYFIFSFITQAGGIDMAPITYELLNKHIKNVAVESDSPNHYIIIDSDFESIRSMSISQLVLVRSIADDLEGAWDKKSMFIQSILNQNHFLDDIPYFVDLYTEFIQKVSHDIINSDFYTVIGISIVGLTFFDIIYLVVFFMFRGTINGIVRASGTYPDRVKVAASRPLLVKKNYISPEAPIPATKNDPRHVYFGLLNSIFTIICICLLFTCYAISNSTHVTLNNYSELTMQMSIRKMSSIELIKDILALFISKDNFGNLGTDANITKSLQRRLNRTLNTFEYTHIESTRRTYTDNVYSNEMLNLRYNSECGTIPSNTTGHAYYKCLPMDSRITFAIEIARGLINIVDEKALKSLQFAELRHVIFSHLAHDLDVMNDLLIENAANYLSRYSSGVTLTVAIGIISSIFIYIYDIFLAYMNQKLVGVLKSFILRLPPTEALKNPAMLELLMEKQKEMKQKMPLETKFVMTCRFPIALLSKGFVVEAINPAFPIVLGYDLSHIIGQDITLFSPDNKLIRKNGREPILEVTSIETECVRENGQTVLCMLTLIPNLNKVNDLINYTLVIFDLTELDDKKHQNQLLQEKNMKIMDAMFPAILSKAIDSKIPECAVICVAFHQLIEPAHSGAPSNRKAIVQDRVDNIIKRYPSVMRISFWNYMFIAACLPTGENNATGNRDYVSELLVFAAAIASDFSASNSLFSIGIDVGGPLLVCQSKGRRKHFISTGKPMILALRLAMAADHHGSIAVSQTAYEALANHKVKFEEVETESIGKFYYMEADMEDLP